MSETLIEIKKDPELSLIELQMWANIFCWNLEMKALGTVGVEKTILDKIIDSEDYQKLKSLTK